MDDTLIAVIAETLDCSAVRFSEQSGLGKHPKWDSLGHIKVMIALEDRYGITVSEENVALLITVADIRAYLAQATKSS